MCGIFGWVGKNPQDFNKAKFDILGIFNVERGKHSCGVTVDGDIFHGVDNNKLFHDFLVDSNYESPKKYPFVIGHTRQATQGAWSSDNAHPFGFGNLNDDYEFVGVHNGKLHNYLQLAKDFGVEKEEKINKNNFVSYRQKIDSEVLLEILYKSKEYKVLSEYRGAAALVFCNINEPNVVYFYHGKSKKFSYDKEAEEERPLFFYVESKNSMYVSSIAKSLYAIGGVKENVFTFNHNIVYKVTDGDIANAEKFPITRNLGQWEYDYAKSSAASAYETTRKIPFQENNKAIGYNKSWEQQVGDAFSSSSNRTAKSSIVNNIYNDMPPINSMNGKIYMQKLRYWRNGHLINGIYVYLPKDGFYLLGDKVKDAHNRYYDIINKYFDPFTNTFVNNTSGFTKTKKDSLYIPFFISKENETDFPQMFYFYEGIRIATEADYEACVREKPKFAWDALSVCAAHPVCDVSVKNKKEDQQNILFEGVPVTDTVCPLGSDKIYTIENGNCTLIESVKAITTPVGSSRMQKSINDITALEEKTKEEENKVSTSLSVVVDNSKKVKRVENNVTTYVKEDILERELNDIFKSSLKLFPFYVDRLVKYPEESKAKKGVRILNAYLRAATKLMTVDVED